MHEKVHLLIGRSCCLPRCNSLDDKIKLNGMHRSIGVRLICSKFFLLFYSTVLINFPYYSFDYARLFFL